MAFELVLNGATVRVGDSDAQSTHLSLLTWLRKTGRTGTKEGCAEGDCGACSVALVETDVHGKKTYRAINACITLLPMVAGREIVTVEGIANGAELHPVQSAMVKHYGSQCGYCTPGFVVSMFEGYYRENVGRLEIGDQLNGNLCRCTGYRPIRDAMVEALGQKAEAKGDDLFQLRLKKPHATPYAFTYESVSEKFARPGSLADLLAIKAEHREKAELVAGATEIGVYINKAHRRFPFLVSTEGVAELRAIEKTDTHFRIGGGATLTMLEEAIGDEYPAITKMLWAFASRQIRNRATLAGNIVTASPIGDMPPILLALDAEVVLTKQGAERTVAIADFFVAYRKTVLEPDEIVRAILLPRAKPQGRLFDTYKVSKRRELDISIVATAFVVDRDAAGIVQHARFAYGGVAATPVRAVKTEAFVTGRAWDADTLAKARNELAAELAPIDDHRSGAQFRRDLIVSLFEKFFRGESNEVQDEKLDFCPSDDALANAAPESAVVVHARPTSRSSKALPHDSAVGHVTGSALYVDDTARRREMLDVWPLTSPHAHARVISIDTSEAEKHPGIACVLTAKDVPGMNDVGAVRHDEPLFAQVNGEVSYHGQLVAAVIGQDPETCRVAATKIKVVYEPLETILGARAAIAKESWHTNPHVIKRGDFAAAHAKSPNRLEGELEIGGQEHFYLEAHAAWAEPSEDDEIFISSSTQHPTEVQAVVGHVLHIPRNKITVQSPRMGGGFGGKETQGNAWAAVVALAATKTKRPVRVQLDRDLDMILTGKRHPFYARYQVGFDEHGKLLAMKVFLVADGGWALDLSESICDRGLFHLDNSYYVPNVEFTGRVAKTHVTSHTAFRGFGGPQGMLVIEEILDRVARRLELPAEKVREANLYRGSGETNTTHYGQELDDERLPLIWSKLLQNARFAERRAEIDAKNAKNPHLKHGLAITPVKFGISFTASWLNQAGALVLIYRDGTVQVNHGGTEMGQGLYVKMKGIAMRELGISAEAVRMMKTQTDKVPNTSATAASSGADLNGAAVKAACEQLRERLAPIAAELLGAEAAMPIPAVAVIFEDGLVRAPQAPGLTIPFERVVDRAYMLQVQLSATGFYRTPGIGYDKSKGKGKPFYYFAYGAAVTEVVVDGFSGMKRAVRVDILHDVGESLNPAIDRGQIEGAFVQGMGWLTGEELKWSNDGRLLTHSASTYQIPSIGDAPAAFNVELLSNAAQNGVVHGSKAVGEPPLMLAISVREAIRDAIAAFGKKGGEVFLPSPATHEAIHACIQARTAVDRPSATSRAAE